MATKILIRSFTLPLDIQDSLKTIQDILEADVGVRPTASSIVALAIKTLYNLKLAEKEKD